MLNLWYETGFFNMATNDERTSKAIDGSFTEIMTSIQAKETDKLAHSAIICNL